MRSDISVLRNRSFHLRNLSLYHCANSCSLMHRDYSMADFEFYGSGDWSVWKDLSFDHVLKPKHRLKFRPLLPIVKLEYVQLSLDL